MTRDMKDVVVVLGPTASGKTALACQLAACFGGEILSADSRQVYRGLDIGSGKDIDEYVVDETPVPYHLIDIVDLSEEYNVFRYQRDFFEALAGVRERRSLPIVAGGTGMYLDAVLCGYELVEVPEDPALRDELAKESDATLVARLRRIRPEMHNTTDTTNRARTVRAIEIAEYEREHSPDPLPALSTIIIGIDCPRGLLHARIERRLRDRIQAGLIEEVESLLAQGVSVQRLRLLGLEYRFVADYLQGRIRNRNDLTQKLASAIKNFAKRQMTWFRRMERQGIEIHWIAPGDLAEAASIITNRRVLDAESPKD